jgi:hypothetical protein
MKGTTMEVFEGLVFEPFLKEDIPAYTAVMKRAFDEDARIHLHKLSGGPPGYDNGEYLGKWALHPRSHAYKVTKERAPVGLVIVWINENGINNLGCLFIDAKLQNRGLGLIVWRYVEHKYPETLVWRTETPGFSKRNHHFYMEKCGFRLARISKEGQGEAEVHVLEKKMPRAANCKVAGRGRHLAHEGSKRSQTRESE